MEFVPSFGGFFFCPQNHIKRGRDSVFLESGFCYAKKVQTILGNLEVDLIWVFPKIGGKPPKSSISIGFSIINHPFWGTTIFGNSHIVEFTEI